MAKTYRRFIKINGKTVGSPFFDTSTGADDWYRDRLEEKDKVKSGRKSGNVETFLEYTARWMRKLTVDYDKPTWGGYESNLRLHLLPYLKDFRMDEITRSKCREVLMNVTRNGYSANHRKHVQATLSKIFTDAMNEDPPQREDNPCYRMKFEGKRQTIKYVPKTLESDEEVAAILKAARELSDMHFLIVCLGVMGALRKSELIALRWRDVRWKSSEIRISARYRQAMQTITPGTKSGENTERVVPIPATLLKVLFEYRQRTAFPADENFIICQPNGRHWRETSIHVRFDEIRKKAERPELTLHSLRHTYGRLFAAKTGNLKALQSILGHVSPATTAIYSELAGSQVKPFAALMNFQISDTSDTTDTKATQKQRAK